MKAATILALVAALLTTPSRAEDKYSNDDLCRAIGETSKAALQAHAAGGCAGVGSFSAVGCVDRFGG